MIIRNPEGKILILQRAVTATFAPNQWEFVNGTMDPHETAEETAVRETFEETGLTIRLDDLRPGAVHELTDDDGRWIVIPFWANTDTSNITLSNEHQAYRWVSETELKNIPYVGEDYRVLLSAQTKEKKIES